MIVLGIDPGSHNTGYAFLEKLGQNQIRVLEYGVLRATATDPLFERLGKILASLEKLVEVYQPNLLSLEDCFVHHNARSALILGQARGAVLSCAWRHGWTVREYLPTAIKYAVAGAGRANKETVAVAMQRHLKLKKIPTPADASDALAIAWVGACEEDLMRMNPYFNQVKQEGSKANSKAKKAWISLLKG